MHKPSILRRALHRKQIYSIIKVATKLTWHKALYHTPQFILFDQKDDKSNHGPLSLKTEIH